MVEFLKKYFLLAFCFLTLSSCSKNKLPSDVLGAWVRQDDKFEGTILEISKGKDNKITGTLVYVSDPMYKFGFRIGDLKIKNIKVNKNDECEWGSLVKNHDGYGNPLDSWYEDTIVYTRGKNEFISRNKIGKGYEVGEWQRWLRVKKDTKDYANYLYGKGQLCEEKNKNKDAIRYYRQAIKIIPNDAKFLNILAWTLATAKDKKLRNPKQAIKYAIKSCELTNNEDGNYLDTLAAAHAASGNFEEAIKFQNQALSKYSNPSKEYLGRLALYRKKQAYVTGMKLSSQEKVIYRPRPTGGSSRDR